MSLGSPPFLNATGREGKGEREKEREEMSEMQMVRRDGERSSEKQELSFLDLILSALRRSMVPTCRIDEQQDEELISTVHHMDIGWPTNVKHITHVTFDRFHGFLGLPLEFEVEIPCKALGARYVCSWKLSLSHVVSYIFLDIGLVRLLQNSNLYLKKLSDL